MSVQSAEGTSSGTITITGMTSDILCKSLVSSDRVKMRIRELLLFPEGVASEKVAVRRESITGQVIGKLRSLDGSDMKDKWEEVEEYNPVIKFSDCTIASPNTVVMIRYTLHSS